MQINIDDLEAVIKLVTNLIKAEPTDHDLAYCAGSYVVVDNPNGYRIGALEYDGNFWTFNPEGYGKTDD